jgi:AraC family transcriptional regulator, positive regulator of tynA and feaB
MACRTLTFDTAQVPARERVERWTQALAEVCGRLFADPHGAATLEVEMAFGAVGGLRVGRIAASRHRVGLTPALARAADHPVAKVIVQTRGTTIYAQGGEEVALSPGEGLVYDVARPHVITSDAPTEHLVAIIPHALIARRGISLGQLSRQRFSTRGGVGRVAASLLDSTVGELATLTPDSEPELAASLLNLLLAPIAPAAGGPSALRYRIKRYIRDRIRDPELTIDEIARALGCSTRYLHRAFADEDQTITDHIWAQRIEGCRDELARRADRTISEVAFAWGFSSSAHFSRLFRKRFGVTPSELRRASPRI